MYLRHLKKHHQRDYLRHLNGRDLEKEKIFAPSPEDYEQGMRYYNEQVAKNEERIQRARKHSEDAD